MPLTILVTKSLVKLKKILGNSRDLNTHRNTSKTVLQSKDFVNNYENMEKN